MAEREKLIELKDLQITFGSGKKKFVAVDHVNFDIYKGETFSLVGESGSGKTTIGRAICRINPTSGGDIFFKGQKINGHISKELDKEVIRKVYADVLADENSFAFFLMDGDTYHGFCHGAYFNTFWLSGMTCYVSSIITNEDERGKGCGVKLMDHAKELAKARGCKALVLDSGMPRTQAHRFYEIYGFEKSCYGFDYYLEP